MAVLACRLGDGVGTDMLRSLGWRVSWRWANRLGGVVALVAAVGVVALAVRPAAQTSGSGSGLPAVPSVRILTGTEISPAAAATFYTTSTTSSAGLCASSMNAAEFCSGGTVVRSPELKVLARALRADANVAVVAQAQQTADRIYEYVRNTIDTEFLFGLHKGALGASIDQSGTAFDQAQLMVELLREAGLTARYQQGTITLTAAEVTAWTGLSRASAVCDLFATGGIPYQSTAGCGSGAVGSVTLSHVWVQADVGGASYLFDPAYKPYTHKAGLGRAALHSAMGLNAGSAKSAASGGMAQGTEAGVAYVASLNAGQLNSTLQAYSNSLLVRLNQADLEGADLGDVIGGREILPAVRPAAGWQQTSFAYGAISGATWTGNIPDRYRASLRVVAVRGTDPVFDKTFFADEIYGRRLELASRAVTAGPPVGNPPSQPYNYIPQIKLDGVVLAESAATASAPVQLLDLQLTADHPFAAGGGIYADSTVGKRANILLPVAIVHGWGRVSSALLSKWEGEQFEDSIAPETQVCNGAEECDLSTPTAAGDLLRARIGASWLAQFSRAAELHGELANARVTLHHSVGVVTGDYGASMAVATGRNSALTNANSTAGFILMDETSVVDLETSFGMTSRTSDVLDRRAAVHALAASAAALEGSVLEQLTQTPDAVSTARRFAWGNAPETGETPSLTSRRAYRYTNPVQGGSASALVVAENLASGRHETCAGCTADDPIAQATIDRFRNNLSTAIFDYAQAGFDVTASAEALLGPGSRHGTEYLEYIIQRATWLDYHYARMPSRQNGGALIANKYDANGDPIEIAHVLTRFDGRIKGGGGPSTTQLQDVDAKAAADFLKDQFVGRSAAAGVDLMSGRAGWSTPTLTSVGQGEFPHQLGTSISLSGGAARPASMFVDPNAKIEPVRRGVATNWDGAVSISSSGLEAMGESRVQAAAPTVAAFAAMQDLYRAAPDSSREVIGALIADWWTSAVRFNVASISQGGSSEQHLNTRNGWIPASGGGARLTVTGSPQLIRPAFGLALRKGSPQQDEAITRAWKLDGLNLSLRGAQGDVRTYDHWTLKRTGLGNEMNRWSGFRLNSWTFPEGVTLTLGYENVSSGVPVSVSSNLSLSLSLTAYGTAVAPASAEPNCEWGQHLQFADAAGRQHKVDVRVRQSRTINQRPTGACPVRQVYQPGDLTTPSLRYTYGATGLINEAEDAIAIRGGGRSSHRFFVAEGYRGERADPLNGRYAVERLQGGRLSRHIDEEGRVASSTLDGRGRVLTRTSAWGDVTSFRYDNRDNVTEVTRSPRAGCGTDIYWCQTSTVTATYNPTWNRPDTITLPATVPDAQAASTWTFAYDGQGRLVTRTSPVVFNGSTGGSESAIWRTWYDAYGRVTKTRDPTGIEADMVYGGYGQPGFCLTRQIASAQAGGLAQTAAFTCNAVGDVLTATDPRGNVTTTTYDALRRKTAETGPAATGIQTQWTYDTDGNVTQERRWDTTASLWRAVTTTYSATNQPLTVTDPAGDVTRTCYDGMDRAVVAVDPTGRATRTTYNLVGQSTQIERWFTASTADATCALTQARPAHLSTNRWRAMEYNSGGLQSAEIDGNGNATTMTYDGLGRPMLTTFADGKYIQTLRNERDQVYITFKRSGDVHQAFYDPMGRIDELWEHAQGAGFPEGRLSRTSYDLASRPTLTQVETPKYPSSDGRYVYSPRDIRTYGYDAAGRVQYDRVTPNTGTMGSAQLILTYGYDPANNRTSIQWPDGYIATYRFDAANRTDRVNFGPAATPNLHQADIGLDSMSRHSSLNRSNGVNTAYAYENDNDLSQINHAWAPAAGQTAAIYGFAHDAAGRITGLNVNRPDLEWSPSVAYARSYGVANNLNQLPSAGGVALTWDDNGNLDQYGTTDYQWTWGNRLARVIKPGSTTEYAYDSQDRRTTVVVDGVMTRTLWSGADEVGEYDIAGAVKRRFIPDGSGAMDARLAVVDDPSGAVHWFHTDHQGSVIATSNGAGQAEGLTNYSPHGEFGTAADGVTALTVPPTGSPFGYTGRQWDGKAGLYQYRARYYSPELGIFLSHDPIGTKDDPNLYGYVANDPVNNTDPTGTCTRPFGNIPCPPPASAETLAAQAAQDARVAQSEPVVRRQLVTGAVVIVTVGATGGTVAYYGPPAVAAVVSRGATAAEANAASIARAAARPGPAAARPPTVVNGTAPRPPGPTGAGTRAPTEGVRPGAPRGNPAEASPPAGTGTTIRDKAGAILRAFGEILENLQ